MAFDKSFLNDNARPEEWPTRVVENWDRPAGLVGGVTLACRIITPSASVNAAIDRDDVANLVWVAPPPDGLAVEVDVVLTNPVGKVSGWPGKASMQTELVGRFQVKSGETVWIVSRVRDMPKLKPLFVSQARYFHGKTQSDLVGRDVRAVLFAEAPDGSRVMYDCIGKSGGQPDFGG